MKKGQLLPSADFIIRPIEKKDNAALANVIRTSLEELNYALDGTVYTDPNTDRMYECYQTEKTAYWIAEFNGKVIGGSGIGEVKGDEAVCELQRMFLTAETRGKGIGQALMSKCIGFARTAGYKRIYLETFPNLHAARKLYERSGFEYIDHPMGDTGHFSCDVYMVKMLETRR